MAQLPRTASVTEASQLLGLSKATVYRAIHAGDIPAIRIGGRLLVLRAHLERMLRGEHQPPPGVVADVR